MSYGVGRWHSCVRGLWESLALASEPDLVVVMIQAPPVDDVVVRYLLDVAGRARGAAAGWQSRHALLNLADDRDVHLSEKLLDARDVVAHLRVVLAGARGRGHLVEGLSGYASSTRMARLAEALGLELMEAAPQTLVWGTKAGSRQIFRSAAVPHPPGSYEADHRLASLARGVAELARTWRADRWMIKVNDGFGSGHGNAVLDVGDLDDACSPESFVRGLRPACAATTATEFASRIAAFGAVIERLITATPGGGLRFPSAIGRLRRTPAGLIGWEILGTHEQVIGPQSDFAGCSFPALADYRGDLIRMTGQVLGALARLGVTGHAGIDFIARPEPPQSGAWHLDATEINLRQTGSTHPNGTVRAVVNGRWLSDGSLRDHAEREVHYTGTDSLISESYRGISARRLVAALLDAGSLSYDPAGTRGVVPHLWTTLEPFGKIGVTAIGRSLADCERQERRFTALLDRLANRQAAP